MTLTDPQHRALELLSRRQCYTSPQTYGDSVISGATAKRLVELGLARYVRGWQVTGTGATVVEITDKGKLAIGAKDLHHPDDPPCAGCPRMTCGDYELCRKKAIAP